MKKIMFWLVLIVGIVVLIGSCKKDDDVTTTTATSCAGSTSFTTISSCSSTADGGIAGIDNATHSGTYSAYHVYGISGGYSVDNSTDCIDNSTLLGYLANSIGYPTGTASYITNYFVTSSTTFGQRYKFYSDSGCSTETASVVFGYDDLSNGGRASGLDTSKASNPSAPSTASKLTYNLSCAKMKGSTAAGVTWIKTFLSGSDPTVGTEHTCDIGTNARYALMFVDDSSASALAHGNIIFFEESETAVPTNWDDPDTLRTLQ